MSDRISANEILYPGQDRWSSNGFYQLVLQEDSNLVLYRKIDDDGNREPLWASDTYVDPEDESADNKSAVLQADGNFVLYNADGQPLWQSESYGYGAVNPFLLVQDDGNLVLYDEGVEGAHWATGTSQ